MFLIAGGLSVPDIFAVPSAADGYGPSSAFKPHMFVEREGPLMISARRNANSGALLGHGVVSVPNRVVRIGRSHLKHWAAEKAIAGIVEENAQEAATFSGNVDTRSVNPDR